MKPKHIKQKEAVERQKKHDALTPQQKLNKLNQKFGRGIGAHKERAKLKSQLNKKKGKK